MSSFLDARNPAESFLGSTPSFSLCPHPATTTALKTERLFGKIPLPKDRTEYQQALSHDSNIRINIITTKRLEFKHDFTDVFKLL